MIKTDLLKLPHLMKLIFKYVRNPWAVFLIFLEKKKYREIKFQGNLKISSNRYCIYRVFNACHMLDAGVKISNLGKEFLYEKEGFKMIFHDVVFEPLEEYYYPSGLNYKDKTVLDVGAFIGDTALLFKKWGARKIIAYEAQPDFITYLKRNINLNNINAEVYPFAVWDKDGVIELRAEDIGMPSFLKKSGDTRVKLKAISWNKVLKHAIDEGTQIAKVDCEGCERFLTKANKELIKKIPYWIIETHNISVERKLIQFFTSIKFDHRLIKRLANTLSIHFFSLHQ